MRPECASHEQRAVQKGAATLDPGLARGAITAPDAKTFLTKSALRFGELSCGLHESHAPLPHERADVSCQLALAVC
jgi:hypothetical protein